MPTILYPTMDLDAIPTAGKTYAYLPLPIKSIDLYKWLVGTAGTLTGKLQGTLYRPDNTTVMYTYDDVDHPKITLLNTEPKYIKILLSPTDIPTAGNYGFVAEFKQLDGWLIAPKVTFVVTT